MGRMLPVYRSRKELLASGQTTGFVFPTETLAKDAAYLDVSLILTAGAYVRAQGQEPAFAITDGVQVFRLYYHGASAIGRVVENPHCELRMHTDGPAYWRLLPTWKESFPSKITQFGMTQVAEVPIDEQPSQGSSDTTRVRRSTQHDDAIPDFDEDPDATVI